MFLHVEKENDVKMEKLVKENELIATKLETVEGAIAKLDLQIQQSEDVIAKLNVVEKKFEHVIGIEKRTF